MIFHTHTHTHDTRLKTRVTAGKRRAGEGCWADEGEQEAKIHWAVLVFSNNKFTCFLIYCLFYFIDSFMFSAFMYSREGFYLFIYLFCFFSLSIPVTILFTDLFISFILLHYQLQLRFYYSFIYLLFLLYLSPYIYIFISSVKLSPLSICSF